MIGDMGRFAKQYADSLGQITGNIILITDRYFRTMMQVIFPMAKPSIITVILFNFLSFWNEYIIIKTLVTDKDQWTLPAGLLNLMQAQQSAAEYGPMYAGLVLVMLPVLILYICVQKNLTKNPGCATCSGHCHGELDPSIDQDRLQAFAACHQFAEHTSQM